MAKAFLTESPGQNGCILFSLVTHSLREREMVHVLSLRWFWNDPTVQGSFRLANGDEIVFDTKALKFATQAIAAHDERIDALFTSLDNSGLWY